MPPNKMLIGSFLILGLLLVGFVVASSRAQPKKMFVRFLGKTNDAVGGKAYRFEITNSMERLVFINHFPEVFTMGRWGNSVPQPPRTPELIYVPKHGATNIQSLRPIEAGKWRLVVGYSGSQSSLQHRLSKFLPFKLESKGGYVFSDDVPPE
jgi:hypothetical protein